MQWVNIQRQSFVQIFQGSPTWNGAVKNDLKTPVYGQVFKVEPLSGTPIIGLRFELYGCGMLIYCLFYFNWVPGFGSLCVPANRKQKID